LRSVLLGADQVSACEPDALSEGALSVTHNQKMHGEQRFWRNSSCTDLRGLKPELIAVLLAKLEGTAVEPALNDGAY
jgi:hypothetical protein